jgi:hypothetical protein
MPAPLLRQRNTRPSKPRADPDEIQASQLDPLAYGKTAELAHTVEQLMLLLQLLALQTASFAQF